MLVKLRNPLVARFDGLNGKDEWCIDTANIIELYMEKSRCYVLFYTSLIYEHNSNSTIVCSEITVEEYDEIFEKLSK